MAAVNSAKTDRRCGGVGSRRTTAAQPSADTIGYVGTSTCGNGRSLEVVSKESFQQRLEGMSSSCLDCLAERRRDTAVHAGVTPAAASGVSSTQRLQKANRVKRNSPIVVCLRDSIRLAGAKSRMKPLATTSNISTDRPANGLRNSSRLKEEAKETTYASHASSTSESSNSSGGHGPFGVPRRNGRGTKNFNAFLSAIEKAHTKEEKPCLSAQNLDHSSASTLPMSSSAFVDVGRGSGTDLSGVIREPTSGETVLNNIAFSGQLDVSSTTDAARTVFAERENVDIICNDLHSCSVSTQVEGVEDSDHSEGSSCRQSSSECSDAEIDGAPPEEVQLSKEEINRLSEHANGFSVRRYEVPPHECPECLSAYFAYTHYYAQGSKFFKIEVLDRDDESYQCYGTPDSMPDSVFEYPPADLSPPSSAKAKLKVSHIGQPHNQTLPPFTFHRHIDTVSLDLTGSDVTFTVEQHAVEAPTSPAGVSGCHGTPEHLTSNVQDFYHNFYCTMFGFVPYVPGYSFIPAFYFMFPMWSIPKPPMMATSRPQRTKSKSSSQEDRSAEAAHAARPPGPMTPPRRPWISLSQPDVSSPVAIYTVMCYNVLCDKYATRQLYGYCPSWALNWEFRKKNILEEIHQYSADIINLQEVETEQFYNFFLPALKAEGYEGIFSPKSRARTMTEADRKHVDGCAIFYKHSKFSLIKEHLVEFNQVAIETAEGSEDMINRVMTKDNIGLAALLETKDTVWENGVPFRSTQFLLVATCHIHWDPECCDVKLIQTMMLMNKLKNIMEETQAALNQAPGASSLDCNSIPLILCGDLNSLPDSGVVEYLSLGRISANHRDFKDIGYEDSLRKLSSSENKDAYSHAFRLSQAYSIDVMPFTNYTCDFKGTIDYVFYSRDFIRPLGILGSLDQDWFSLNQVIGCPNPQIPSDHLPLLVEFEMQLPSGRSSSSSSLPSSSSSSAAIAHIPAESSTAESDVSACVTSSNPGFASVCCQEICGGKDDNCPS